MFSTYDACTPSGGGTRVDGREDGENDTKNENDGSKPFYVHVLCAGNNDENRVGAKRYEAK